MLFLIPPKTLRSPALSFREEPKRPEESCFSGALVTGEQFKVDSSGRLGSSRNDSAGLLKQRGQPEPRPAQTRASCAENGEPTVRLRPCDRPPCAA